jgi:hypothetical protein
MKKHGMFGTKIYASWSAMLYRCRNPRAKPYPNYGGRGISVCSRWESFDNFHADMGATHWDGAELDRIDVNGNYEPSNCRWATTAENQRNRRKHLKVVYQGVEWSLPTLCASLGISRRNVNSRLAIGWSVERAVNTPVAHKEYRTVVLDGTRMLYSTAAAKCGVTINAMNGRLLRGWSIEEALGIKPREVNA